tara:strand:- start:2540 stop:3274 length:735 start_codon:yes stop_codon:yes gene_type:complete
LLRSVCLLALTASFGVSSAHANDWTGEGSLSAGLSSGNSQTSDAGVGFKSNRDGYDWRTALEGKVDYGKTNGIESKNRSYMSAQADRKMPNNAWSAYGRTSYEQDEIAGLNSRVFLGMGIGYVALDEGPLRWSLESSPGLKMESRRVRLPDTTHTVVDDDNFAVQAGSRLSLALNESVKVANNTNVVYAEESTQIVNDLSLTAALIENISARISFDVRHDTAPLENVEPTDTTTRISLVYGFGG